MQIWRGEADSAVYPATHRGRSGSSTTAQIPMRNGSVESLKPKHALHTCSILTSPNVVDVDVHLPN